MGLEGQCPQDLQQRECTAGTITINVNCGMSYKMRHDYGFRIITSKLDDLGNSKPSAGTNILEYRNLFNCFFVVL